jgi:outer membrane protein
MMKLRLNSPLNLLALAAAAMLAAASNASAQSAGTFLVKAGVNKITPKVESGDVSAPALPGTKTAVGSDTKPVLILSYMLTDNWSAELGLGLPYKHDLFGDGAIAGTGKLGSSEVLPPTAFIQYRFLDAKAAFRPYVGLGITYAYFQKETGSGQLTAVINTGGPATTFQIDNRFGATLQVGASYAISEKWFADVAVTKTYLKTTAHYSPGQTQDITFDPVGMSVGIGYKF